MNPESKKRSNLIWLITGSILFVFIGLRWNISIAAWLVPVFLIRFFRSQDRFTHTLIAIPSLTAAAYLSLVGGWDDLDLVGTLGISVVRALPFLITLYFDRLVARRTSSIIRTLTYPAAFVMTEFLLSLSPIGTSLSVAVTQFDTKPFIQLLAISGVWGIPFMLGWFASTANALWEHGFDIKKAGRPVTLFAVTYFLLLFLGGLRFSRTAPTSDTVRIAGVTMEQQRDYWGEIIDQGTPAEASHRFDAELAVLEDKLFDASARAAKQGAKIIFWSEANQLLHLEDVDRFMERARAFAQEHQVYFVPAVVVLHNGHSSGDNKLYMIEPNGNVAYAYTKTKSWYPTDSDGILRYVDTPHGRLSTAICFDMDFPSLVRQASENKVDIMLVPAYDWEAIKSFHTQVGLMRAVEYGFSAVRQVNEGTSMAVDYRGNVLAYQDFFSTTDRVMLADIPTQGVDTLYGQIGDCFAYLAVLVAAGLVGLTLVKKTA